MGDGGIGMEWKSKGEYHQHSGDYTIIKIHSLGDRVHYTLWGPGHNHGYFRSDAAAKKRAEEIEAEGKFKKE